MKFGPVPVTDAEGCILAHATDSAPEDLAPQQMSRMIPKGTVLTATHLADIAREGIDQLQVARLEDGDVAEDDAAQLLAQALSAGRTGLRATSPVGGRVNLVAEAAGLALLDAAAIHRVNSVSPAITVATVLPYKKMGAGGLVATIKIIPFAVAGPDLARACDAATAAIGMAQGQFTSATLIETRVGRDAPSDKGRRALAARVRHFGMMLTDRCVVPHEEASVADALAQAEGEVLFILTATATSDIRDTAPQAVRQAGGEVIHYGMPVDPGNLLFLGRLGDKPVIGLPGCARSPAINGADWVLERIICGVPIEPEDIMGMGVGGLLKEIPERGRPRE
ncbi:molybdopterin-binding protein [Pseudooctadecabacter sp.]|uniref:molybdopterin-binding protein n=1 Tax=Pseudooctadecabacter sp. TaxID=1966338 RepID=UPI0035C86BE3